MKRKIKAKKLALWRKRCPLWKMPYHAYLKTPHWRGMRRMALKAAGYKCVSCGRDGMLYVHHKTYDRRGREKPTDLVVLCRACHAAEHPNHEAHRDHLDILALRG